MLREVFPILALVGWEIGLNHSGVVLTPFLGGLLSVFPRRGIAYKVTSLFPSRRRYSAAIKKLKYHASSSALHAMALAANRGQIPRPVLIVAA
jgi:hypothetical protein